MSKAKFGTFDDLINISRRPMQPIARRLREIIVEIHPEYVEVVRLGDRAATFGIGPKKMSEGYAYILPYDGWVNLGLYKGAELADPKGLLQGTGAKMRHVKIRSIEVAEQPAIRALVKAAVVERKKAFGR